MCISPPFKGDQSEISSNCPSRKGSTFSVVNRQSNSITPSTSSHHITVSSRERDLDTSTGNASKDISFGTNHSLDRGHGHSHSHHHHHHHSLDRDSANVTNHSNLSCSASTRGQFTNTPPSNSVVAKSRSSTSNNSLTLSNHIHSSEEQINQHRKSNIDATGNEWPETTGCSRGGSDRSRPMMKPPKDPKSTNHHHHSRHKLNDEHQHQHQHHQHQHRKKSIGSVGDADGNSLGGMRKISAAGSVSSVLSENSMGSYSKSRTNSNDFSHKMPAAN